MEMQIQPPKPLPLHIVGWLSLPWRHWGYLSGSIVFGLLFLTFAPFAFLVRLLGLVVPFLVSLGLAFPYGGLHMDEWLMMAWKYARRPAFRMHTSQEQDESLEEPLEEHLDGNQQPAEAPGLQPFFEPSAETLAREMPTPPPAWPGQPAASAGEPRSDWAANTPYEGQRVGLIGQPFFIRTSGVFWRGAGELAGASLGGAPSEITPPGESASGEQDQGDIFQHPPTQQPENAQPPASVIPFPAPKKRRDHGEPDRFLLYRPVRKSRGNPPRKRRWA
jgi:hypothetical protein